MLKKIDIAIEETFNRLNSLSKTKLQELLDAHKTGDIAKLIQDSNAFKVGELESEESLYEYNERKKI